MHALPITQFVERPGILDIGWGHPAPQLLPLTQMRQASAAAFARYGSDLLAYGANPGPGPLLEILRERIRLQEGRSVDRDQILLTAGASHGLDLWLTLNTCAGDIVLVENPTYHLALKILGDHQLQLVPVPADGDGLKVDALADILQGLSSPPRALYTVPLFANPTGATLSGERRIKLLQLAEEYELIILEDDVYREIAFEAPAPPSLWSKAPAGRVVRFGSFTKSFAPGIRVGWLTADAEVVRRMSAGGLLDSGGGICHFSALLMAEIFSAGAFDAQVERLRGAYQAQRDALYAGLGSALPTGCHFVKPGGGFFIWVELPAGLAAASLLISAERQGVSFLPGSLFACDAGGGDALRLSFSMLTCEQLEEAAFRLGRVIHQA